MNVFFFSVSDNPKVTEDTHKVTEDWVSSVTLTELHQIDAALLFL